MTSEPITVNGSHEPDLNEDEKILKPRKSILSNDQDKAITQNGNNEDDSVRENGDNDNVENGYDGGIQNGEVNKPSKRALRQKNVQEKRETTPNRQSLPREAKTTKESSPKPEIQTKRELRQREVTPRKNTPKPETPTKRELKHRGTSSKVNYSESHSESRLSKNKEQQEQDNDQKKDETEVSEPSTSEEDVNDEEFECNVEESCVIIEENTNGDIDVVSIDDSVEEIIIVQENPQDSRVSVFRRDGRSSLEMDDASEASSSSSLDTPPINEEKIVPLNDIQGRKPINSFSRFPGRNVSITSTDSSLKRKADDSFEEEGRKRFAGETASGSEKSPGWRFFSPSFNRVWSPSQTTKTQLPSSTPFLKREEQDSMAVNYDSKTKLDLDDSMESEDALSSKQKASTKWCTIM